MRISSRTEYGIRIMTELALFYNNGLIQSKVIAERENIPLKYMEQIIILLRNSNLIKSVRGVKGGYYLSRSPEKITLREIIENLEGPLSLVNCVEDPNLCKRSDKCITIKIWTKLCEVLTDFFDSINLKELVKLHIKKNPSDNLLIKSSNKILN